MQVFYIYLISFMNLIGAIIPQKLVERGYEYWYGRNLYHIIYYGSFGFLGLVVRDVIDLIYYLLFALIHYGIAFVIQREEPIKKLYQSIMREYEEAESRTFYTTLTVLLLILLYFIEYKTPEFFLIGMLALAFGDGLGEIMGREEGEIEYNIRGRKTLTGSFFVFLSTFVSILIVMYLSNIFVIAYLPLYFLIAIGATVVEALSQYFLDNIGIPFVVAISLSSVHGFDLLFV